jgi:hypothetical protein
VSVRLRELAPWPQIDGYLDRALDLAPRKRNASQRSLLRLRISPTPSMKRTPR